MNKSTDIQKLARVAIIAALYFVCTVALAPISFGAIQFRLSEILVLLCFYRKEYCYSLVLGCALANLFSPLGIYDVVFGTLATAISVVLIYRCKHLLLATLFPTLSCIIVGLELYFLTDAPLLLTSATVMLGEFVTVTVVGYPVFRLLERNKGLMRILGVDLNRDGKT